MRRFISACFFFLVLLVAGEQLSAQPTNVGSEFYLSFPANWDYAVPKKWVRLYIVSSDSTQVTVYGGPTRIASVRTHPDSITTVDIPLNFAQALTRNDVAPVPQDQVYPNKGLRIVADDPITLYGINHVTYTTEGILALPTSALGREYIIASAPDVTDHNSQKLPSQYVVTAPYDNTVLTIVNSWDTYGHVAGEVVTVAMNKGDVYSAMSKGSQSDLTGTIITSNRPVAVLAGQYCSYIPSRQYASCNHLVEMMLPVSSWGKVYHLVPFMNRLKGDFIRVFAGAANARVSINGQPHDTLPSKGGREGAGWFTLLEQNRRLLEFTSDKPIAVAQYNNANQYDNVSTEPILMALTPMEQYQRSFSFATPKTDYPQNFVSLVMDSSGWKSIEISEGNSDVWRNLSNSVSTPQNFPTQIDGVRYAGVSFEIRPGVYRLRGTKPFAGYSYGWSNYESYGYPLAAAVVSLSEDDLDAPVIESQPRCPGNIEITVTDMPEIESERSNLSTIELDTSSYNFAFDPRPEFIPGETRTTTFRLNVLNKATNAMAILVVSDMRGNISRDTVTYTPVPFDVIMTSIDFGTVDKGPTPVQRTGTLRNTGSRPVTIREVIASGPGFTLISPTGEFVLSAAGSRGDTREVTVAFTPALPGTYRGAISVRDSCGEQHMTGAELNARVGTPIIVVDDIEFGMWPVASPPKEGSFRIRNTSTDDGVLIVTGVTPGTPSQTSVFATPNGYPVFPLRLEAGEESAPITVTFDPAVRMVYYDEILLSHNAGSGPGNDSVAALNGRGVTTTGVTESGSVPGLSLGPVAPTPADDKATLDYQIPVASSVEITLVDLSGRTVLTVLEKSMIEAGSYTLRLDLSALPAGSYFCRMSVGDRLLVYALVVR